MNLTNIPISKLHPFARHPFQVRDDEELEALIESIQAQGILSPIIVRPKDNTRDEYEIISGHRRFHAAMKAGLKEVPAFIYPLDRDAAAIALVDSNLHREHILPSEKAFAYKMKLEAIKHQGRAAKQEDDLIWCASMKMPDEETSRQAVGKCESSDLVSDTDSGRQVQRYIRLTYLEKSLLALVDEGRIAFTPAVELSYLPPHIQQEVFLFYETDEATPSYSQSVQLRKLSESGELTVDKLHEILSARKPNQRETVKIPWDKLRGKIPESYTIKQREEFLVKAVEHYSKFLRKERAQSR